MGSERSILVAVETRRKAVHEINDVAFALAVGIPQKLFGFVVGQMMDGGLLVFPFERKDVGAALHVACVAVVTRSRHVAGTSHSAAGWVDTFGHHWVHFRANSDCEDCYSSVNERRRQRQAIPERRKGEDELMAAANGGARRRFSVLSFVDFYVKFFRYS